jgi:hypothetical protein
MVTPATGGGEAGDRDASSAPTGSEHQNNERTGHIANSNAGNKDLTDVEVEQLFKYIDTNLGEDAQTVMSIDVDREERAAALKRIIVYGPRMTGYFRKLKEEREHAKAWLPEGGSEAGNALTGGKRQLDRIERAVTRVEARVAAPTPTPLTQTRTWSQVVSSGPQKAKIELRLEKRRDGEEKETAEEQLRRIKAVVPDAQAIITHPRNENKISVLVRDGARRDQILQAGIQGVEGMKVIRRPRLVTVRGIRINKDIKNHKCAENNIWIEQAYKRNSGIKIERVAWLYSDRNLKQRREVGI